MITETFACLLLHCSRCNKPNGNDEGPYHWETAEQIDQAFPEGKEGPDGWRKIGDRFLCGDCHEQTPDGTWVEKGPLRAIDEAKVVRARLDFRVPVAAVRVTRYEVSCLPPDHIEGHHFTVRVEYRGRGLWAVTDGGYCLGRDGEWDYESLPSNREDDWLANHRFDLDTALELAKKAAPLMTVNGWTVEQVLADIAARDADVSGRSRTGADDA